MGRFEDYPGLVGTGVQLLENRLGATPQGFESLPLRQEERNSNRVAFFIFWLIFNRYCVIIELSISKVLNVFGALRR